MSDRRPRAGRRGLPTRDQMGRVEVVCTHRGRIAGEPRLRIRAFRGAETDMGAPDLAALLRLLHEGPVASVPASRDGRPWRFRCPVCERAPELTSEKFIRAITALAVGRPVSAAPLILDICDLPF
jgi:hypothetical protein